MKPYESIEFQSAKQDGWGGSAVIGFQSLGPEGTQVRVTITFDVGLGMWLLLKLFGKRVGVDRLPDEEMDKMVGELEGLGGARGNAPR